MMVNNDRKATLQALHTAAIVKAVRCHERNVVLDGRPPPINNSEKGLTRKERSTLAQLRSGYCRLRGSHKSRIKKDASLDVCADCGTTPHDVKHFFVCLAPPTTLIPSDLWSRPTDAVRELSYLEARDPDWNEHGLKQQQQIPHSLAWSRKAPSIHDVARGGTVQVLTNRDVKPPGRVLRLCPAFFSSEKLDGGCSWKWERQTICTIPQHYILLVLCFHTTPGLNNILG